MKKRSMHLGHANDVGAAEARKGKGTTGEQEMMP
jgi:hypothetical protein